MAPDPSGFRSSIFMDLRKVLSTKWDIIFDKDPKEWIAFKPALGLYVYPCYSCRHMFYCKKSFLDHINRRAVLLKFNCLECNESMMFYNRCSFLLHCRKHYNLDKGQINLNNLEILTLPFGLAGFSRHADVPYLFDVEEDIITCQSFMNAQFYHPNPEDKGKGIISLKPINLVINRTNTNGENESLALKQIAKNIPKCQFITLQAHKEIRARMQALNQSSEVEVKSEPAPDEISFTEEAGMTFTNGVSTPTNGTSTSTNVTQVLLSEKSGTFSVTPILSEKSGTLTISSADFEDSNLPIITKVETVFDEPITSMEESSTNTIIINRENGNIFNSPIHKCTECQVEVPEPVRYHFLGENRPSEGKFRCINCRLICPTLCSFQAHERIHAKRAPYVCPDCGIEYPSVQQLLKHMDEVCYHMTKSIRIRCPGRRCGKIFASEATFGPHFRQFHIDTLYACSICRQCFNLLSDCEEHCLTHEGDAGNIVKLFSCLTCGEDEMVLSKLKKHIDMHTNDLSRCIYIYMCKFCKCYFRSVQSMSTHLLNCKVQKLGLPSRRSNFLHSKYTSGQCQICFTKIIYLKTKPTVYCNKCVTKPIKVSPMTAKWFCPLCKCYIEINKREKHRMECKFSKPHIMLEKLDLEKIMEQNQNGTTSSNNSSDLDGSHDGGSPRKIRNSDSSDENRPRKRQRPSKPKKPEISNDLTAEEPIRFNGTYHCRLCDYTNTRRASFHEHIKNHRTISTAYQCMECGECFVVKPSLIKHLLHFHNIASYDNYLQENDCYDKGAVNELAKVVKAPYLANEVQENQCKVCLEQFGNAEEHNKHFRSHGMAFLMKNSV